MNGKVFFHNHFLSYIQFLIFEIFYLQSNQPSRTFFYEWKKYSLTPFLSYISELTFIIIYYIQIIIITINKNKIL